jgi:hypothetical protein
LLSSLLLFNTYKLLVDVDIDPPFIVLVHEHGGAYEQIVQFVSVQVGRTEGCTIVGTKLKAGRNAMQETYIE